MHLPTKQLNGLVKIVHRHYFSAYLKVPEAQYILKCRQLSVHFRCGQVDAWPKEQVMKTFNYTQKFDLVFAFPAESAYH